MYQRPQGFIIQEAVDLPIIEKQLGCIGRCIKNIFQQDQHIMYKRIQLQ